MTTTRTTYEQGLSDGYEAAVRWHKSDPAACLDYIGVMGGLAPPPYELVDLSPLGLNESDAEFCWRIVKDYKVAAIPVSAFYEQDPVTSVVRFCFAKKDETLDTALERLSDAIRKR